MTCNTNSKHRRIQKTCCLAFPRSPELKKHVFWILWPHITDSAQWNKCVDIAIWETVFSKKLYVKMWTVYMIDLNTNHNQCVWTWCDCSHLAPTWVHFWWWNQFHRNSKLASLHAGSNTGICWIICNTTSEHCRNQKTCFLAYPRLPISKSMFFESCGHRSPTVNNETLVWK